MASKRRWTNPQWHGIRRGEILGIHSDSLDHGLIFDDIRRHLVAGRIVRHTRLAFEGHDVASLAVAVEMQCDGWVTFDVLQLSLTWLAVYEKARTVPEKPDRDWFRSVIRSDRGQPDQLLVA